MSYDDFNLASLENEYESDSKKMKELRKLLFLITDQRILRFNHIEMVSEYPELLRTGLLFKDGLSTNGKDTSIKPTNLLLYSVYRYFAISFEFNLDSDIPAIQKFIKQVGDYFTTDGVRHGITQLLNGLTEFLLFLTHYLLKTDLYIYALQVRLSPGNANSYSFFNAYLKLLPVLKYDVIQVWEICKHFALEIKVPEPGTFDAGWNSLVHFLYDYAQTMKEKTSELKTLVLKEMEVPVIEELLISVCKGLKTVGDLNTEELLTWVDHKKGRKLAFILLRSSPIENSDLKLTLIGQLVKIETLDLAENVQLTGLFLFLLQTAKDEEQLIKEKCKAVIEQKIMHQDATFVKQVLNFILFYSDNAEYFVPLFKKIIDSGRYNEAYSPFLDHFFSIQKEIKYFIDFLKTYSQFKGFQFSPDTFKSTTFAHRERDLKEFEKAVINLLIDNNGLIRWTGHQILFSEYRLNEKPNLSFSILTLDAVSQYKFTISIATPFEPPNYTIPLIAPLLTSPYKVVQEVTLCKLEELIRSYKYEVIEEVEAALPNNYPDKKAILTRLNESFIQLSNEIILKCSIKELDPRCTQANLLRIFSQAFSKKSKSSMKDARKKRPGILQFARNVIIARGGGSKQPNNSTIQPLGKFSFSYTLPRIMFIRPEANDYERQQFFLTDWEPEYKGWEQIISS